MCMHSVVLDCVCVRRYVLHCACRRSARPHACHTGRCHDNPAATGVVQIPSSARLSDCRVPSSPSNVVKIPPSLPSLSSSSRMYCQIYTYMCVGFRGSARAHLIYGLYRELNAGAGALRLSHCQPCVQTIVQWLKLYRCRWPIQLRVEWV